MNIFLGLIGVHEFFSFDFPLREYFFVVRPSPRKFSNGPSFNGLNSLVTPATGEVDK